MQRLEASRPVSGPITTQLVPSAHNTLGSGAALQAEPSKSKRGERILRIEINSNDRNFSTQTNPADFQWVFPYPLKNVTSMVIVGGTVPIPLYTIDTPFNSFIFDTGSDKKKITIPPGSYTSTTLASALSSLLHTADGTNVYTVGVDPTTQLLSVASAGTNTFGFLFGSGSNYINTFNPALQQRNNPSNILGFLDTDYYSTNKVITAPYPVNLSAIQRIYLYMNYETSVDLRSIVLGGGRAGPSAIFYCTDADTLNSNVKSLHKDTYDNVISPGLIVPRIRTIQISLRDEFGTVLNTNNRAVTFLLEITVLE
jgi:hypothetical protein